MIGDEICKKQASQLRRQSEESLQFNKFEQQSEALKIPLDVEDESLHRNGSVANGISEQTARGVPSSWIQQHRATFHETVNPPPTEQNEKTRPTVSVNTMLLFTRMLVSIKMNLFALLTSLFSIFIQITLLMHYRRLPREKKNTHFYYYLFTSSCFTLIMLLLEALFYISPQLIDCTCMSSAILFILFENLSQWCLIGYGLSSFVSGRSFVLTVATIAMAVIFATMKLCLTHKASPSVANCHASFISTNEALLAAIAVQMTCFTIMILVFVAIFVHKFNDDGAKRMAGGKISILSATITGSIALLITTVFGVIDYETDFTLFNYVNLSIVYSIQNCLICVLIILYCPTACSSFARFPLFHHGLRNSRVNTAPKEQRYCSMSLRSHRSRSHQETTNSVSQEEIKHNVEANEELPEVEIAGKY